VRTHLAISASLLAVACGDNVGPDPLPPVTDPIPYVDPFIGSGGFGYAAGSAFPGAASPSGLAKVGPDTDGPFGTIVPPHAATGSATTPSRASATSTCTAPGCRTGVLSLMVDGPVDATRTTPDGYQSPPREASTRRWLLRRDARPGRHPVEITATARRTTYHVRRRPAGNLVVDLAKHLPSGDRFGRDQLVPASSDRRAASLGGRQADSFGGYDLYFDAVTATVDPGVVWSDERSAGGRDGGGRYRVGCGLAFAPSGQPVEVQVGLVRLRRGARQPRGGDAGLGLRGDPRLSRGGVARPSVGGPGRGGQPGGAADLLLGALPRLPDADGGERRRRRLPVRRRRAGGGRRLPLHDRHVPVGHLSHAHPLYDLVAPDVARDAVRSLAAMADVLGFFPKWPIATGESGVMLGASAEIVLADAYLKGVTDFDAAAAYAILRAAALGAEAPAAGRGGRGDVDEYLDLAYVPASRDRSASTAVEYA
jgi:hypothetical protein